jgi:hypothetical protein
MKNLAAYVHNTASIASAIPDLPEYRPAKGEILRRAASRASQSLENIHFEDEDDAVFNKVMKLAEKNLTVRLLGAVGGYADSPNSHGTQEEKQPSWAKGLQGSLEATNARLQQLEDVEIRRRQQEEREALIKPLTDQINALNAKIDQLSVKGEGGGTEPSELLKEVQGLKEALRLKDIEAINSRLESIQKQVEKAAESAGEKGLTGGSSIDQLESLSGTIERLRKLFGSKGELEGVDWKTTAIATGGDVLLEMTRAGVFGNKELEGDVDQPNDEETTEQSKVSKLGKVTDINERRVFLYVIDLVKKSGGQAKIKVGEVAAKLKIPEDKVSKCLQNLYAKKLLSIDVTRTKNHAAPEPDANLSDAAEAKPPQESEKHESKRKKASKTKDTSATT